MNQTFTLDTGYYYILIGLVGSVIGMVYLGVSILRALNMIKKNSQIPKPNEIADDWKIVESFARRQVYVRFFLFLSTLVLFTLLWQNAYVCFDTIQINNNSIKLEYLLGKDYLLEPNEISTFQIVHERNGGHLEITTTAGKSFRSVLVRDVSVLEHVDRLVRQVRS